MKVELRDRTGRVVLWKGTTDTPNPERERIREQWEGTSYGPAKWVFPATSAISGHKLFSIC